MGGSSCLRRTTFRSGPRSTDGTDVNAAVPWRGARQDGASGFPQHLESTGSGAKEKCVTRVANKAQGTSGVVPSA